MHNPSAPRPTPSPLSCGNENPSYYTANSWNHSNNLNNNIGKLCGCSERSSRYSGTWKCIVHRRRGIHRALCPVETKTWAIILQVLEIIQIISTTTLENCVGASGKSSRYSGTWECMVHRRRGIHRALCPLETEIRAIILQVIEIIQIISTTTLENCVGVQKN